MKFTLIFIAVLCSFVKADELCLSNENHSLTTAQGSFVIDQPEPIQPFRSTCHFCGLPYHIPYSPPQFEPYDWCGTVKERIDTVSPIDPYLPYSIKSWCSICRKFFPCCHKYIVPDYIPKPVPNPYVINQIP